MESNPPETSILQAVYPLLAPLAVPFMEHLVVRFERTRRASPSTVWDVLVQQVTQKRDVAYTYMNPFVAHDKEHVSKSMSIGWLLQTLSVHNPKKKPVPRQTLSNWHGRRLLRYQQHGLPELDSAAALFITRLIDRGEDNWLPSFMKEDEPFWWCWRQDSPQASVVPCPVPLPADIPPDSLLWTPWAGAAWQPEWLGIGDGLGAIRFAGVRKLGKTVQWTLSAPMVRQWCPELHPALSSPFLMSSASSPRGEDAEEVRQQFLQALATVALYTLALPRFHVVYQ